MSTIITNLRGARVTPIHRGSVLLSKQEDLCSTSYVEPAVNQNRQPGFRRELVEQNQHLHCHNRYYLHSDVFNSELLNKNHFPNIF